MVTTTPPVLQSFADAEHGWRAAGPGVEATNDGGRHWRVVFRWGTGGGEDVTTLLRTSASAGLVTFEYDTTFATSDGGAHWYVVRALPNEAAVGDEVVGHGALLFGSRGDAIREADNWPLTDLRCGGHWYHVVQSPLADYGPKPRNICLGGPGATIRTHVVLIAPTDPASGSNQYLRLRALTRAGVEYDLIGPDEHTVVSTGTFPAQPPLESWGDRNDAWRYGAAGIETTSDGGHHWRLVLRIERSSGGNADLLVRTSAASGLVSVSGRGFVTNDAGAHWYEAQGGPTVPAFGRGRLLLGTGGSTIDRAVHWPLPRVRCTGRWVHSAEYFNLLSAGPKPRTICLQDSGVTIRMKTVYRLPPNDGNWVVLGQRLVNGTLYADVVDETTEQGAFVGTVVYRNGRATFTPR